MTSHSLLLIFSLVFAVLAAAGVQSDRVNLFAAAFACFIASLLF